MVRALEWMDIPRLAELERTLFADDAWSEQTWWAELAARPRRDYLVLTADPLPSTSGSASVPGPGKQPQPRRRREEIVGYAGLDLAGDVADVMTIAIAPAAQGRALGGGLLEILESRAREAGAAYLMLEVRDDNEPAKTLYTRAGFEVVRVRRRYYQPGDVDALELRKKLSSDREGE